MEASFFHSLLKPHLSGDRKMGEGTLSAVLVIIHFVKGKPYVILTKRSNSLKNHAGQFSFPGGTYSQSDRDLMQTAIRETFEEIGLAINDHDIIGNLRSVHTLTSNFVIVPFIAIIQSLTELKPDRKEIDAILDVPLIDLLKTIKPDLEHKPENYRFEYDGNVVWGATARILKQMYDILQKCGMI
jgi:8-oxo-dGTP pyrophosphatase MutT (NUDIX family)